MGLGTHNAKQMKEFLEKKRTDQISIPAGMTSNQKPLTLVINKPFKNYSLIDVNYYVEHRERPTWDLT